MSELKTVLKEIFDENVDGVSFLPDSDFNLDIKGFQYNKKSKYEKYELGHVYHIILYKCDDDGSILNPDHFSAILTDPCVYVNSLINSGFYGVVAKKNKQSKKYMKHVYDSIVKLT